MPRIQPIFRLLENSIWTDYLRVTLIGSSYFEEDQKKASGHKSESMVAVYDRKIAEIESTS